MLVILAFFIRFAYTHFVSFSVPACLVPWGRGRGILDNTTISCVWCFSAYNLLYAVLAWCEEIAWCLSMLSILEQSAYFLSVVQGLLFVESVDMAGASPPVVYSPLNGLTTWMHPPFFLCFATPLLFVRSSSGW